MLRQLATDLLDVLDERDRLETQLGAERDRANDLARQLAECEASGEPTDPQPDPDPEPPTVPDPPPPTDPEPQPEDVPDGFTSVTTLGVTPEAREENRVATKVRFQAVPGLVGVDSESGASPVATFASGVFRGVLPIPYTDTSRFPEGGMPIDIVRDGAVVATLNVLPVENGWGQCLVTDARFELVGRYAWEMSALIVEGLPGIPDGNEAIVPELPYRVVHAGPSYSREIAQALASGVDLWVPPTSGLGITAAVEVASGRRLHGAGSGLSRLVVPDDHTGPGVVDAGRHLQYGKALVEGYGARGLSVLGRLHRIDWTRVAKYKKGQHGFEMQSGTGHDWRDLHVSMAVGDLYYAGGRALYGPPEARAVTIAPDGTGQILAGPLGIPFDEGLRSIDGREVRATITSPSGRVFVVGPTTNKRGNLSPLIDAAVPPEARTYEMALGWIRPQTGEITGLIEHLAAERGGTGAGWTATVRPADQSTCLDAQLWNLTGGRSGRALFVGTAFDRTDIADWRDVPNGGTHHLAFDGRCWEFLRLAGAKNKAYQLSTGRGANPLNRGAHFVDVKIRGSAENGATIKTERGPKPLAGRVGQSVLNVDSSAVRGRHMGIANAGVGPCEVSLRHDGTGTNGLAIGNTEGCTVLEYSNSDPRPDYPDIVVTKDAHAVDLSGVSPEATVRMSAEAEMADEDDE